MKYHGSDPDNEACSRPATRLWVVGADSGIGAHIAQMSKAAYDDITATTRDECDVRMPWDIDNVVSTKGPFTHVVYCSGVNHLDWSQDIDDSQIIETFDVNVVGFIRIISRLAQSQRESPTSIVAISSDAAYTPMRTSMAYCASKAALSMAVRVAAREHGPVWRVNAIAPAAVEGTGMSKYVDGRVPGLRGWTLKQAREYEAMTSPLGRRVNMGEVASLALDMLAGPEALNGSIISLTGGK